jgi:hypothetical protein
MFKFFKKHKLVFDIVSAIVAALASFLEWYDFFSTEQSWRWLLGSFFAVWAMVKTFDVIGDLQKKKQTAVTTSEN